MDGKVSSVRAVQVRANKVIGIQYRNMKQRLQHPNILKNFQLIFSNEQRRVVSHISWIVDANLNMMHDIG